MKSFIKIILISSILFSFTSVAYTKAWDGQSIDDPWNSHMKARMSSSEWDKEHNEELKRQGWSGPGQGPRSGAGGISMNPKRGCKQTAKQKKIKKLKEKFKKYKKDKKSKKIDEVFTKKTKDGIFVSDAAKGEVTQDAVAGSFYSLLGPNNDWSKVSLRTSAITSIAANLFSNDYDLMAKTLKDCNKTDIVDLWISYGSPTPKSVLEKAFDDIVTEVNSRK